MKSAISVTSIIGANGTYIEYYPSAPISCRHRYWRLLTKNSVFSVKLPHLRPLLVARQWEIRQYVPSPYSVAELHMQQFDEKFGSGVLGRFTLSWHSTSVHSLLPNGTYDKYYPSGRSFVCVPYIWLRPNIIPFGKLQIDLHLFSIISIFVIDSRPVF